MSYNKQTWKTGDVITAEKLNHMEDGIANPGYTVETQAVAVVPEQSIETIYKRGIYQRTIIIEYQGDVPDTLTITFQGQEYVCNNYLPADDSQKAYGANTNVTAGETVDWSQYPFHLSFYYNGKSYEVTLVTESAGTYTVKATAEQKTVTTSEEFKQAVESLGVLDVPMTRSDSSITLQSSWSEISTALQNGGARLYSYNYYGDSELTITGTILNAGYSTSQGTKTYTVDAIVIQSSAIKLLHFTTNNQQGTGLTATLS